MEEKSARIPELRAKFEARKRQYGLERDADGND